ncbi:peptide-methionine (S)-S-oxide reductase MsrA [Cetobacterium sp. 8H]|uniref:peptide-methionine (S)-S-oxide reductase MsrA n=1 Tax=Cetobacterium sp. 8H TaxID=2759681 RepID=UPI00163B8387|nr:peptide-methionine (S)-S-oxide reductase MsrA [Cetobacterium sp. 8H]MBC2852069.1 peptide-methionine (S)-S-oxide reductase MsrA [Cetobacterium sp. 8H]
MKRMKILIVLTVTLSSISMAEIKAAYLAGGCFWCTEADMEKVPGVIDVISGYSGGNVESPTYDQVSSGSTGHMESIRVEYDSDKISYSQLLYRFLKVIDPTDNEGQFVDRGYQYSPAIFYQSSNEEDIAKKVLKQIQKDGGFTDIKVKLLPINKFYVAEKYHQDYYKKNPVRYEYYRYRSGRDQFLEKVWGKKQ